MLRLYFANICLVEEQQVFDEWFQKVDSQRKDKIVRCKNKEDKQRSLLAGILLKYGLEKNREESKIFYSISHSGEYVICALADRVVGVDIENKFRSVCANGKIERLDKIAKKCLTMGEEIFYRSLENEEKVDALLRFWTRKESYSKAIGMGLGIDFSIIDTQKKDALYWSDWLKEGYYCSLYVEDGRFGDMKMQEVESL